MVPKSKAAAAAAADGMEAEIGGEEEEGEFLLGQPTFMELGGGRLRCVESGHEIPDRERDRYSRSLACRRSLIDTAVAGKKPPLNIFRQHPANKSMLFCEITGVAINKSEKQIWKHVTGRKFMRKLEQKEEEEGKISSGKTDNVAATKNSGGVPPKSIGVAPKKKKKKKRKKDVDTNRSIESETVFRDSDSEEADFWIPPGDGNCAISNKTSSEGSQEDGGIKEDAETSEPNLRTKKTLATGKKKRKKMAKNVSNDGGNGEDVEADKQSLRSKRAAAAVGTESLVSSKKHKKLAKNICNGC